MKENLFILFFICILPLTAFASESIVIPAGDFHMGCSIADNDCENDEGPQGGIRVFVPTFEIDRYEVSVAEYRQCVEAGKCTVPKDYQRNNYCNYGSKERDAYPVNCVDWQEAVDYCEWSGARLPFEAEWEKAARAGTESRYPWGQAVSCKNAILDDGKTMGSVKGEPDGCGEDRSWHIGSRDANAFGIYDMHGNVGEWVANWYGKDAYSQYSEGELLAPNNGKRRVVRGGSWDENKLNLRSSFRNVKPPVSGKSIYGSLGFRCAKPVKK